MKEDSKPQQLFTYTLGRLFPRGAIEILDGHRLVFWSDQVGEQIVSNLSFEGSNYVVAPLDPSLAGAMRFPATTEDFGSVDALVEDLIQGIAEFAPLDPDALTLLAVYVLGTWAADCLPTPPLLNLWGGAGTENTPVQVLECLCRRPLVVSEVSVVELCDLPFGLSPTLIVRQPSRRSLEQMLAAANVPATTLLRGGRLISYRHAAVVCTRAALPAPALALSLLPTAAYHRISTEEMKELTARFAPRLLRYRLVRHAAVTGSNFDCPGFAAETRLLARVLGATVEGSPLLHKGIVQALLTLDEECKAQQSQQTAAIVLEALLVHCHENQPAAAPSVKEIAEIATAILAGRHDTQKLTGKEVSSILRNQLGVKTRRHGAGYRVEFGVNLWIRIHRLAATFSVLSLSKGKDGCPHCAAMILAEEHAPETVEIGEVHTSRDLTAKQIPNVREVHQVHKEQDLSEPKGVHHVHEVHGVPTSQAAGEASEVHNVHDVHPEAL